MNRHLFSSFVLTLVSVLSLSLPSRFFSISSCYQRGMQRQLLSINLCFFFFFQQLLYLPLGEKCPYSKSFWSVFYPIWTEYGQILHISPYSVRMRENADHSNLEYGHILRSVYFDVLFVYSLEYTVSNKVSLFHSQYLLSLNAAPIFHYHLLHTFYISSKEYLERLCHVFFCNNFESG